jgi:8-oxo-dGTP diphosphatase
MNTSPEPELPYDPSVFPRPSVTTDIVLFTLRNRQAQILLIQRKEWPFAGQWALPGGFVRPNETLDAAARRELAEETGVSEVLLEQLRAFGDPGRDPRTWVITVAFTALISSDQVLLRADTDAADARWFPLDDVPQPLAFDHQVILDQAVAHLRARLETSLHIAAALLPARFTLTELQGVYEILLDRPYDKRNFRKWVLGTSALRATDQEQRGKHRPALLYEFTPEKILVF